MHNNDKRDFTIEENNSNKFGKTGINIEHNYFKIENDLTRERNVLKIEKNGIKKQNVFRCPYEDCYKSYDIQNKLDTHLRTHPFKCPFYKCFKAFNEKGNLKTHMRIHTGEKPYKCEICRRAFKASGHLTDHLRTHTKEKPFQCLICKRFFSRRTVLREHIKNLHQNENEKIPIQEEKKNNQDSIPEVNSLSLFEKCTKISQNNFKKSHQDDQCNIVKVESIFDIYCDGDENRMDMNNESREIQEKNNLNGKNKNLNDMNKKSQNIIDIPCSYPLDKNLEKLFNFNKTSSNNLNSNSFDAYNNNNNFNGIKEVENILNGKNLFPDANHFPYDNNSYDDVKIFHNDFFANLNCRRKIANLDKNNFSASKFQNQNIPQINLNFDNFFNFNITSLCSNENCNNSDININSSIFKKPIKDDNLYESNICNNEFKNKNYHFDCNKVSKGNLNNFLQLKTLPTFEQYLKSFDRYHNIKSTKIKDTKRIESNDEALKNNLFSFNSPNLNVYDTKSTKFNSINSYAETEQVNIGLQNFDISKFE